MLLDCYVNNNNKVIYDRVFFENFFGITCIKKWRLDVSNRAEERLTKMNNDFNNKQRKST